MATAIDIENPVALAMYEAAARYREEQPRRVYLGMSSIGDPCARKIWFGFRGYTALPLEGRLQMIFDFGNRVEEEVLKWLRLAGYEITDTQREFSELNGLFKGHCDGLIKGVTQKTHVLEIKSASDARFKAFKTGTVASVSPTYLAQLQCYMGYTGLERGVWVVQNKNTSEIYVERLHFDMMEFKRIEARARRIISSNRVPPRGYPEGAYECRMCDYRLVCAGSHIQKEHTCGTCVSCMFDDLQPRCVEFSHDILHWGRSCEKWEFRENFDEVPF